jgi:hypothetical protein
MNFEKHKELWQLQILADHNLTHATRNVAIAISVHLNRNSRIAWPGRVRLAKMVAVSTKTVQRAIAELERAGHFQVLRSRNGVKSNANRYVPILKRDRTHVSPPGDISVPGGGTYVSPGPLNEPLREPLPYGHDLHRVPFSEDSSEIRKAERKRSGEEEKPDATSANHLAELFREGVETFGEEARSTIGKAIHIDGIPPDEIRQEMDTVREYGGDYRELAYALWRP